MAQPDIPRLGPNLKTYIISLKRRPDRRAHIEKVCKDLGLKYEMVDAVDGRALAACRGASLEAQQLKSGRRPVQPKRTNGAIRGFAGLTSRTFCARWQTCEGGEIREHQQLLRMAEHRLRATGRTPYGHELWGAVGCSLSHQAVLQRFFENKNLEYCLVLEDDATLVRTAGETHEVFDREIRNIVASKPDWGLIYLGGHLAHNIKRSEQERYRLNENVLVAKHVYQTHAFLLRRTIVKDVLERLARGFAADAALVSWSREASAEGRCYLFSPQLIRQPGGADRWKDSDIFVEGEYFKKAAAKMSQDGSYRFNPTAVAARRMARPHHRMTVGTSSPRSPAVGSKKKANSEREESEAAMRRLESVVRMHVAALNAAYKAASEETTFLSRVVDALCVRLSSPSVPANDGTALAAVVRCVLEYSLGENAEAARDVQWELLPNEAEESSDAKSTGRAATMKVSPKLAVVLPCLRAKAAVAAVVRDEGSKSKSQPICDLDLAQKFAASAGAATPPPSNLFQNLPEASLLAELTMRLDEAQSQLEALRPNVGPTNSDASGMEDEEENQEFDDTEVEKRMPSSQVPPAAKRTEGAGAKKSPVNDMADDTCPARDAWSVEGPPNTGTEVCNEALCDAMSVVDPFDTAPQCTETAEELKKLSVTRLRSLATRYGVERWRLIGCVDKADLIECILLGGGQHASVDEDLRERAEELALKFQEEHKHLTSVRAPDPAEDSYPYFSKKTGTESGASALETKPAIVIGDEEEAVKSTPPSHSVDGVRLKVKRMVAERQARVEEEIQQKVKRMCLARKLEEQPRNSADVSPRPPKTEEDSLREEARVKANEVAARFKEEQTNTARRIEEDARLNGEFTNSASISSEPPVADGRYGTSIFDDRGDEPTASPVEDETVDDMEPEWVKALRDGHSLVESRLTANSHGAGG